MRCLTVGTGHEPLQSAQGHRPMGPSSEGWSLLFPDTHTILAIEGDTVWVHMTNSL